MAKGVVTEQSLNLLENNTYNFGETSADTEISGVLKKAKYYESLADRLKKN